MMDNSCWAWNSIWRLIVRRLSASGITHNIPQSPTCFPPTNILWSLHAPYIFSRIALHRVQESFSWSSSASAFIHCRKPHSYKEEDYHSILGIAHRERDILSASLAEFEFKLSATVSFLLRFLIDLFSWQPKLFAKISFEIYFFSSRILRVLLKNIIEHVMMTIQKIDFSMNRIINQLCYHFHWFSSCL